MSETGTFFVFILELLAMILVLTMIVLTLRYYYGNKN